MHHSDPENLKKSPTRVAHQKLWARTRGRKKDLAVLQRGRKFAKHGTVGLSRFHRSKYL